MQQSRASSGVESEVYEIVDSYLRKSIDVLVMIGQRFVRASTVDAMVYIACYTATIGFVSRPLRSRAWI